MKRLGDRHAKAEVPKNWQSLPVQRMCHATVILSRCRGSIYLDVKAGRLDLVKLGERASAITTASIIRFLKERGVEVPK
ncbi:MAG: hypothetical protein C0607_16070 [Azoarcus sp.]|nr:MAG: hypothetical protein C0607_16070 [Azoarcus sp.]